MKKWVEINHRDPEQNKWNCDEFMNLLESINVKTQHIGAETINFILIYGTFFWFHEFVDLFNERRQIRDACSNICAGPYVKARKYGHHQHIRWSTKALKC